MKYEQDYNRSKREEALAGCFILIVVTVFLAGSIAFAIHSGEKSANVPKTEDCCKDTTGGGEPLSDWQVLMLAVAMTESEFRTEAVGENGDWGILQITPVYVAEANRVRLDTILFKHEDAWTIDGSLDMFDAVQKYHNPLRDMERAIRLHNKSPYYRTKVQRNIEFVRRYEDMRAVVVEREK